MIQALILAHGQLAEGLLGAVEALAGPQQGVRALSNSGCDLPSIVERAAEAAGTLPAGPLVIFVDLPGGSCNQAGRALLKDHPEWRLVTGVNVPMLVNFFQNRERLALDEVVALMVSRARDGVKSYPEGSSGLGPGSAG